MPRYYTHYWSNPTCKDFYENQNLEEKLLDHDAGKIFTRSGVKPNDLVYIVTIKKGELFLIAKLQVEKMVFGNKQATAILCDDNLWDAPAHLIAKAGTPMRFNKTVPLRITKGLRFISAKGPKPLKFVSSTKLDRQTLRGVRELNASSAAQLDTLLEPMRKRKRN